MLRDSTVRALGERLRREQARSRLPSVVAGLVRGGRLAWFGGAGDVEGNAPTEETQYRCGSISKTFIAVEVMRLRDEGAVDLLEPVGTYLPELGHVRANIAQLLSHTSGIRAETSGPWWERTPGVPFDELAESSIRSVDVLERPGRRFHYSNVGYAVLGELIRRARSKSWDDVVEEELLRPLGMLRTTTRPVRPFAEGLGVHPHADVVLREPEHDAAAMAPAGQLWSTVGDLTLWAGVLAGHQPELLSPGTAAEMREPLAIVDLPEQPWSAAHGLGLQLFNRCGSRSFGHYGSMPGFLAILRIEESTGEAVVVMTNTTSGLNLSLESDLLSILAEHEPIGIKPWRPVAGGVAANLLELTGTWYWGTSAFTLSIDRHGALQLHAIRSGRESAFEPAGDGTYLGQHGYYAGERLRVVRRSDGSLSHLDIGSFVFSRSPYDPSGDPPGGVDPRGWRGSAPEREHRHGLRPHVLRRDS